MLFPFYFILPFFTGQKRGQCNSMKTRIKEFRAKTNLTQQDLAEKVKVRRETINFLEKGKYNPSLLLAYRISMVFNVTIEDLFIFEEEDLCL